MTAKKSLISISEAAKILQVSPDTLRNWEASGKLVPERTPGGARRYSLLELQELKKELPTKVSYLLSISKAANALNVSKDTLRNWETKGLIESQRTKGKARRFSRSEVSRIQKELGINPANFQAVNSTPVLVPLVYTNRAQPQFKVKTDSLESTLRYKTIFNFAFLSLLIFFLLGFNYFSNLITLNDLKTNSQDFEKQVTKLSANLESLQNGLFKLQKDQAEASKSGVLGISLEPGTNLRDFQPSVSGELITGLVPVKAGGTGQSTYVKGDILYSKENLTLDRLSIGAENQLLAVSNTGVPKWTDLNLDKFLKLDGDGNLTIPKLKVDKIVLGPLNIDLEAKLSSLENIQLTTLNDITELKNTVDSHSTKLAELQSKLEASSSGDIQANRVLVAEFRVIPDKISGKNKIVTGEKSVIIDNTLVDLSSKILITPTSETDLILAVTNKNPGIGFTVSTPKEAISDIEFDWWMVGESNGLD